MGRGKKREGARKLRRSTPEERRQAVEAYRKSGLTQAMFAKQWGVHPMTFSGWVAQAGGKDPGERRGRKPRLAEAVKQEVAATKRQFPTFGFLKIRDFVRRFRGFDDERVGHEVLARDAVWAQDATHIGRLEDRQELQAEVATDRASTTTVLAAVGPPASGEDLREHLKRTKEERGVLPYVWQSDVGSANTCEVLREYLEFEQVIHLRSRVHMPTDNPAAEHKNRELKEESGLGKGVRLRDPAAARARLRP